MISLDDSPPKLLVPKCLQPGNRIGIVAPASCFDRGSFDRGIAVLESLGFDVFVPQDLFIKDRYLAGPDAHRADLVNRLFAEGTIDGIFCARGGFGSLRILRHLDFDLIQRNPKLLVGFSDITALLSVLYTRCGLVTFHGPVVTDLGVASPETIDALYAAVTFEGDPGITLKNGVTIFPGSATGPVAGGNLTTLCHLMGTPFQPDFRGHLLFLEDRGEASYRIDRMLTQMKLAGGFDGLSGLLLGSFEDCGPISDISAMVKDIFSGSPIPIVTGFDVGHGPRHQTIPFGLPAVLDAGKGSLSYLVPSIPSPSLPDRLSPARTKGYRSNDGTG